MDHERKWLTDWDQALIKSAETDRPIIMDFFMPG